LTHTKVALDIILLRLKSLTGAVQGTTHHRPPAILLSHTNTRRERVRQGRHHQTVRSVPNQSQLKGGKKEDKDLIIAPVFYWRKSPSERCCALTLCLINFYPDFVGYDSLIMTLTGYLAKISHQLRSTPDAVAVPTVFTTQELRAVQYTGRTTADDSGR
jgi:hypothetical protein